MLGGGGVSHPLQLTTGLVVNSFVITSPTLAGERMLLIPKVSILSEQIDIFKELTPHSLTYELCSQGEKKKMTKSKTNKHLTLSYKNYLQK